ncbi:hypothetical protein GCM10009771_01180 [Nesterenkonia flava]|uniref:Fibronectin type-III domain-containing protein n=2 Tax=Nesterenkonia flava TaxID=469799 RepID=A0ABU1FWT4_9MICC|nr:hypothetical protein [Nesterenkonia flava]
MARRLAAAMLTACFLVAGGAALGQFPAQHAARTSGAPVAAVEWTEASWASGQTASSDLTAGALEAPRITNCENLGLLGLTGPVRISWAHEASEISHHGYVIQIRRQGVLGPAGVLHEFEVDDPGATQYVLTAGLLEVIRDLLNLGATYTVTVAANGPGEWISPLSNEQRFHVVAGLIPVCGSS